MCRGEAELALLDTLRESSSEEHASSEKKSKSSSERYDVARGGSWLSDSLRDARLGQEGYAHE